MPVTGSDHLKLRHSFGGRKIASMCGDLQRCDEDTGFVLWL